MSYQRDFDKSIRVGVVGVGLHGYRTILPTLTFLPVKLEALCDLNEPLLRRTGAQYGVSRLYTDVSDMYAEGGLDAVFLCVDPFANPGLACAALEAGFHVWMEKPPSVRASEVSEMIDRRGDLVVIVGFKKVFMPAMRKAKQMIFTPEAGVLKSMLAEYSVDIPENGRDVLEKRKMTSWLASGCHPISAMIHVGGKVQNVITHRASHGGGTLVLNFASGAVGTLHLADGMRGPCERYSFYCTNVHVVIDNCRRVSVHRGNLDYARTTDYTASDTDPGSLVWEPQNGLATLENNSLFSQGFYNEILYFCECVLTGQTPQIGTLEFARDVMFIYEAALLSDGQPVEIIIA